MKALKHAVPACLVLFVLLSQRIASEQRFHLRLERAEPAADATVEAPREIRLWFSEQPGIRATSVRLSTEDQRALELGSPTLDGENPKLVRVAVVGELGPGVYSVSWRTTSADGHVVRGDFKFTVEAAGALHS